MGRVVVRCVRGPGGHSGGGRRAVRARVQSENRAVEARGIDGSAGTGRPR